MEIDFERAGETAGKAIVLLLFMGSAIVAVLTGIACMLSERYSHPFMGCGAFIISLVIATLLVWFGISLFRGRE